MHDKGCFQLNRRMPMQTSLVGEVARWLMQAGFSPAMRNAALNVLGSQTAGAAGFARAIDQLLVLLPLGVVGMHRAMVRRLPESPWAVAFQGRHMGNLPIGGNDELRVEVTSLWRDGSWPKWDSEPDDFDGLLDIRVLRPALQSQMQHDAFRGPFIENFYRNLSRKAWWPLSPYLEDIPYLYAATLVRKSTALYQPVYYYATPTQVGQPLSEHVGTASTLPPALDPEVWDRLVTVTASPPTRVPLPTQATKRLKIVEQVGKGIDKAHLCGVVDLRIEPDNIVLKHAGDHVHPVLVDLLIGRAAREERAGGREHDPRNLKRRDLRSLSKLAERVKNGSPDREPSTGVRGLRRFVRAIKRRLRERISERRRRTVALWFMIPETIHPVVARLHMGRRKKTQRIAGPESARAFLAQVGADAEPGAFADSRRDEETSLVQARRLRGLTHE